MIEVEPPSVADAEAISSLLCALGYPGTELFIEHRITELLARPDESLLVARDDGEIVGVLSLHFIPQLALRGDFCRISYLCVAEKARSQGIGAMLESYAVKVARERGCERIELHCHSRRGDAHRFYYRQQYTESPKYLCKSLN
jgi:GNAT superfamily N-acetyltransferase